MRLVDQTVLPQQLKFNHYSDWKKVVAAIKNMVVRGAPAIGCTAGLGMVLGARSLHAADKDELLRGMEKIATTFKDARPTAVNLEWAVDRILNVMKRAEGPVSAIQQAALQEALKMLDEDIATNRELGRHGSQLLSDGAKVLTHCNAGALACVAFGTALGVIRAAIEEGKEIEVLADETRPRLQGMKLTAWELQQDNIPVKIIADNMAATLMRQGKVDCIVVGADRIAANGDTANKIGTYSVAVLAKHHGIPFYVAAPFSTVDMSKVDGTSIPIEEREHSELTHVSSRLISPVGVPVLNYAFDVTPHELITALITEKGVIYPPFAENLKEQAN